MLTEGFFRKLFTYSHDAIFVVDPARDEILDVNPRACSMLGYPREDLLSIPVSAIHPGEMDRLRAFARSVIEYGHGWTDELTCTTRQGKALPAEISAAPIDLEGRVCIVAMVRDISERKLAEERLRRYAQRLEIQHQIEADILAARPLDEIAQSVVPRMRELARCRRASVTVIEPDARVLRVLAADGAGARSLGPGRRLPLGEWPPRAAAGTDVRVLDDGADDGSGSAVTQALRAEGIGAVATIPLMASGEVVGSVNLGWHGPGDAPPAEDLETVREVADELAIAIDQARLKGQVESRAEELEELVVSLRTSDEQRRRLLARLVRAQEDERTRIAADIYDDTIQKMAAVEIRLGTLSAKLSDPDDRGTLKTLEEAVGAAMSGLRQFVFDLRPVALDRHGLAAAIQLSLEGLEAAEGLTGRLESRLVREPPDPVRTIGYRIAQEALANVRRHARATHVEVLLEPREGRVLMQITDDGRGFAPEATPPGSGHLGLTAMRERAEMAGGWFTITSSPGSGTRVEFWLPSAD